MTTAMQMATTATTGSRAGSVLSPLVYRSRPAPAETQVTPRRAYNHHLRPAAVASTGAAEDPGNDVVIKVDHGQSGRGVPARQLVQPQAQIAEVQGVVVGVEEHSVQCEMRLPHELAVVELPRSLFPDVLAYGVGFTLRMTERGGVRQPFVEMREPDRERLAQVRRRLDALIDGL